jgi:hypothetical protein
MQSQIQSKHIFDHIPMGINGSQRITLKPEPTHVQGKPIFQEPEEEEVDLNYIIENKPKASIVREFMRHNLCTIRSEGEQLFEGSE